jgi:hypothetical protein
MNWMGGSLHRNSKGARGTKQWKPRRISKAKLTATSKSNTTWSSSTFQPSFFQYEGHHHNGVIRQTTLDEYPSVAPVVQRLQTMEEGRALRFLPEKSIDPRLQLPSVVIDLTAEDKDRPKNTIRDMEVSTSGFAEAEEIELGEKKLLLLNRTDWAGLQHSKPVELVKSRKRREAKRRHVGESILRHHKRLSLIPPCSKRQEEQELFKQQGYGDGPFMSGALPIQHNHGGINIKIGTDALESPVLSLADDTLESELMLLDQDETESELHIQPLVPVFDKFAYASFPFQELPLSQMPQLRSELLEQHSLSDHESRKSSEVDDILSEIVYHGQSTLPISRSAQNLDHNITAPQISPSSAISLPRVAMTKNVSQSDLVVPMITRNNANNECRSNPTNMHALPTIPHHLRPTPLTRNKAKLTNSNTASCKIATGLELAALANLRSGTIFTPDDGRQLYRTAARPTSSEEVALRRTNSTSSDYRDIELLTAMPGVLREQEVDEEADWMRFVFGPESGSRSDDWNE